MIPKGPLKSPPCGLIKCNGCSLIRSVSVWWDTENCCIPRNAGGLVVSAGAIGEALREAALVLVHAHAQPSMGIRVIAVHAPRYPTPMRTSLRTHGIDTLDAGPKRGAVDVALKGAFNDVIVDELLRGARAHSSEGATWLIIVSGDSDYADDIRRAKRAGLRVAVIFAAATANDFVGLADVALPWISVCDIAAAMTKGNIAGVMARQAKPSPAAHSKSPAHSDDREKKLCKTFCRTGTCENGENCRFAHIAMNDREVCRNYLNSNCKKGADCWYLHKSAEEVEMAAEAAVADINSSSPNNNAS